MDRKNIIIVEDEQVIAIHLNDLLESFGYNVLDTFVSGEDVLNFMLESKTKPDVVFMDIRLKGELDGIEVVNKLQQSGVSVPVIYLTSHTDKDYIKKAKETEPIAFLKKPFDPEQLKATLEVSIHRTEKQQKAYSALKRNNELSQMQIDELLQTQEHLVTATWRERTLKEELQKSKEIIEEQNKKILDSINYAKRIQRAIIPREEDLKEALGNYFMFYSPKDVVSGDFPWLFKKKDFVYVAAVDCTGHGVPGAMMSLISFLLLKNVVDNELEQTPAEILNELHQNLVKTLRQDEAWNKAADGMDVALCRINTKTNEVVYSGAHRPLYHVVNNEVLQYKGDKFPIGGMQYKGRNCFTDESFTAKAGETIYFFSDGLPDQFGGPKRMKFGSKRVRRLIEENTHKSMEEQKDVFIKSFKEWSASELQIDDVLLISKRF